MVCEKVIYNTDTQDLTVKLRPIFQALKMAKDNQKLCSEKVTTLEKLVITEKEPLDEALSTNGASNGTRHEPSYAELAQMCLHETEIISDIEKWCA